MEKQTVHLYVFDTLADWEIGLPLPGSITQHSPGSRSATGEDGGIEPGASNDDWWDEDSA